MMRRLPSMENGQAAFGDFAAAMSPHQTHQQQSEYHAQQFAHRQHPHHPHPQSQLYDHASQYNQHYYSHPPNTGTPSSHSGYPTSAVADPTTPTAAAANYYQPPPTPSAGTPNRHNGYPTSTTPTAAAAATAVLPNNGASNNSYSNFDVPVHAGGNVPANNANGFGNDYHGHHGHHGDAEAWLQSPAATLLVQRCVTAHKWDEPLTRRVLAEYTRFCHLKIRMGDANDQNMVAPSLVQQVWQSHYLDSVRYMEDIQSICGRGTYLHFNHYDNSDHDTKPRRIQSTETALIAMFGNGGIDRAIWTYYTDASTTTAAAAAQTIASRAGGVGIAVSYGYGANAGTTPASSGASKYGAPSSITNKHGGAGSTPSSASRRPPSVLRSSNRSNGTPLSTVSENVVSFKDQIKKEINDDEIEEVVEEEEEDGGDDGTYNDEESIKSDEESSLEQVKKRRKSKTSKPTPKTKTTSKASSVDNQETLTSSSETKTPSRKASSSRKKKSNADSLDNTSSGSIAASSKTKVVVTSFNGDGTKEILVAPTTTAASLRDYYLQSMRLTDHLPETWKFTHKGLLLENDTILASLVPPGMELHLRAITDISPIRIDMFDGSIVEI